MASHANRTAYFEGQTGPDLEYSYVAEVSFEPNQKGLDGGRIQYLVIRDIVEINWESQPPGLENDAFMAWLMAQPSGNEVAVYENGQLVLDPHDPLAATMVGQLNDWFTEKNLDVWGYNFDRGEPAIDLTRDFQDAGRER